MSSENRSSLAVIMVAVLVLSGLASMTTPAGAAIDDTDEHRLPSSYLTVFYDDFETGVLDTSKWVRREGPWSIDNNDRTLSGGFFPGENWYLTESPYGNGYGDPLDDNGNGGVYFPDEVAMIETRWIDLANVTTPRLEFNQMYEIPSKGDGALVYILSDQGSDWTLMQPDSPYPEATGWSGIVLTWVPVVIRLDEFEGQRIRVAFFFKSSPDSVEGDGWQIDEVEVGGKPDRMLPDLKFGSTRIYLGGYSVTSAVAGDVLEFNMSILNEGRAHTGPFVVSVYTDHPLNEGTLIGREVNLEGLGVGMTTYVAIDWVAIMGNYEVLLALDELNRIPEENELNNYRQLSLDVDEPSAGDVALLDMHIEANGKTILGASIGDLVTIVATLVNLGTSTVTTPMVVRAYDGFPAPGSEPIGDEQPMFNGIEANGERLLEIHWRPLEGNHTVYMLITPQDPKATLDFNDDNNITRSKLTVTDHPEVDLVAEDIVFLVDGHETTITSEGANVHIVVTISNQGIGPLEGTMEIGLYIGDPDAGGRLMTSDLVIGTLEPEDEVTVEADWMPELGTHAITVFIDPLNIVYESNEDNNQLGKGLSVARKPLADLSISAIRLLLNGVELNATKGTNEGAHVEVNITVKNSGNEKTKGETLAELFLGNPAFGGITLGTFKVPEGLNPDEVFVHSLFWDAKRPQQRSDIPVLFVLVDARSSEPEVSEFNNFDMRMLPVGESLPDLTISSFTLKDASGIPVAAMTYGVSITLNVEISNVGTAISFQNSNVDFFIDDTDPSHLIDSIQTTTLDIDETVAMSKQWRPDPAKVAGGVHTIIAIVDASDEIEESSTANNNRTATIHIDANAKPNLLVMDVEVKRSGKVVDRVEAGDTVAIRVRVLNLGEAPLYTTAIIELFFGDPTKGGETVAAWQLTELPVGGIASFDTKYKLEEDSPLVVQIDRTNGVKETNENDNFGTLHVTVEPPPDGANYIGIAVLVIAGVFVLLFVAFMLRRRPTEVIEPEPETEAEPEPETEVEAEPEPEVEAEPEPEVEAEPEPEVETETDAEVVELPRSEAEPDEEAPSEEPEAEGAEAIKCPSCGEEVEPDWILCPFCDKSLE